MPKNFELISTVTVGSGGASSIDLTSIPATYTDLVIKISGRGNPASNTTYCTVAFNGSTSSFSIRGLFGNGSIVGSFTSPSNFVGEVVGNTATSNTFSNIEMYVPNYAGSINKTYSVDSVGENNATLAQQTLTAGLWSNTAAITSISFTVAGGNWMQYSTASLYGVLKGSGGATVS